MAISTAQQFGDLLLQFTSDFNWAYNDQGSGSTRDGAFWTPVPGPGFFILGSYGMSDYGDPNGNRWALCVKDAGNNALGSPVDWVEIWNDHGSGGNNDGSCWRPVPPDGYYAMGDLFVGGYNKPPLNAVACVRKDLTYPGAIGGLIWNDQKSGANGDIGVWSIDAPEGGSDRYGFIAANTFTAVSNYNQPVADPAANVLMLPFPTTDGAYPEPPVLTSKARPDDQTTPAKDHTVLVPFTGITDQQQSLDWQIRNSPFYTVERYVCYSLVIFNNNQTQEGQQSSEAVTVGVDKTKSSEFSVDTNITVGYEAGVSLGASAKVSASLSVSLGYKQSTSVSVMKSRTVTTELLTPAQHAAASWTASYQLQLVRADGTRVGVPLQFESAGSSFLQSQYPPPQNAAELHATSTFAF